MVEASPAVAAAVSVAAVAPAAPAVVPPPVVAEVAAAPAAAAPADPAPAGSHKVRLVLVIVIVIIVRNVLPGNTEGRSDQKPPWKPKPSIPLYPISCMYHKESFSWQRRAVFLIAVYIDTFSSRFEGAKVRHFIFGRLLDQMGISDNCLFGDGNLNLPVLDKSDAERRSHHYFYFSRQKPYFGCDYCSTKVPS